MKVHFCASAFIINPENKKILLVKHRKFNKWTQPGGHIEVDEIPEDAAVREAYEETGVKVKLVGERFPREDDYIRPLTVQKNTGIEGTIHVDFFYLAVPVGDIIPRPQLEENIAVKWFSRDELEEISVFEDIKITMDYVLNKIIK